MENNLSDLILPKGIQVILPKKQFYLQEIDRYICIKSFDEIQKDLCIWAGLNRNENKYIIEEKGFKGLLIDINLFNEHFENFIFPEFYMYRYMTKSQKKELELKYFSDEYK
jgi:hypothetical protein